MDNNKKEDKLFPPKRKSRGSLDAIVIAHCLDYPRRADALCECVLPRRVLMEYRYLNARILAAAGEVVGGAAEQYIYDIGTQTGYAKSAVEGVSESAYKANKREVKRRIAERLNLI